ncbi:MAG: SWIM zinc finger family protein [Chloroflexi bacterium]|nr:SWIM zinc finger family protein [Chloroflexota bacterium]
MTTITLTSSESRHAKALALLTSRGQWIRSMTLRDGRAVIGIPSQTRRGVVHLVAPDGSACSCHDYVRRQQACKHALAVRLDRISRGAVAVQPASVVIDGLSAVVRARAQRYDDIFKRFEGN